MLCISVTLAEDQWCWKEKSMKFEVVDKDVTYLDFVQNGFLFTYSSTHDISVVSYLLRKGGRIHRVLGLKSKKAASLYCTWIW
jgi:hypothetical protein